MPEHTRKPARRTAGPGTGGEDAARPTPESGTLTAYHAKRDFSKTPEPAGETPAEGPSRRFVVQRHRARRLHYDLRFEIGGVLVSWAVPRGPTLDPNVKRMAIHVEDHPVEYLHFEGVIPAGEYGGGDVIVWDTGSWEPHATDDPAAAVAAGDFHADVSGDKLRGRFVLVRRASDDSSQEQWVLLHKRDEHAVEGWDPEDHPRSVLSGRTNDEVRANPDRMWRADLPPAQASVPVGPVKPAPPAGKGSRRAAARGVTARGPRSGQVGGTRSRAAHAREAVAAPVAPGPSAGEFAGLDGLGNAGTWEVFGRRLALTNLGKELFPAAAGRDAVTKRDFIRYAAQIAPTILPYLAGRALNMHRFPGGAGSPGFWHKQLPGHAPDWVPRWRNPDAKPGETSTYLVVDEPAALVWAANFGALEWHAWTSPTATPDLPSYALIDIDPGQTTAWEDVLVLARLHRTALDHVGVAGSPKVTGRRGIQVWVPIEAGPAFEETRAWVAALSKTIGSVVPHLVSWQWDVKERGGHARLDYTQNVRNKTLVAPYSPRAAPGAPVSAPISWDELDDPSLRPDGFTIREMPARLAAHGDLFRGVLAAGQVLPALR